MHAVSLFLKFIIYDSEIFLRWWLCLFRLQCTPTLSVVTLLCMRVLSVSLWCFGGTLECLMFPSGFLVWLPFSNVWYFFTVCTSTCWHLILVTGGNVHHTRVCITCGLSDGFLWFMWFYSSLKCFRIRCSDCLPDNAKVESCCLLIFIYSWCLYHCCCFILRTVWSWFESWLGILTGILNLES